jgi:hypothetical protein
MAALLDSRSILNVARVAWPSTTLRWHYRSADEKLIAFSNAAFYGGRLITAPAAEAPRPDGDSGFHVHRVPGIWRDQKNHIEALAVVDEVARILKTGPDHPSVGVVCFNRKQADLIEVLLDERAAEDPRLQRALEAEERRPAIGQLFIRNLENVQGDERDLILFSLGYGPGPDSPRVHARFGPLGLVGGHKRLNVAITRARLGVHLFLSFDPAQLNTAGSKHVGPKLLSEYLNYAWACAHGHVPSQARALVEAGRLGGQAGVVAEAAKQNAFALGHGLMDDVAQILEGMGYWVQRDLGLGGDHLDIALGHAHGAGARIGLDGRTFIGQKDPLTRDAYRPTFWKRQGWRVIRLTPHRWRHQKNAILAEIEAALGGRPSSPPPTQPEHAP